MQVKNEVAVRTQMMFTLCRQKSKEAGSFQRRRRQECGWMDGWMDRMNLPNGACNPGGMCVFFFFFLLFLVVAAARLGSIVW